MFRLDKSLVRFLLFLTCLMSVPGHGQAALFPSPAEVQTKALKERDQCFKRKEELIKEEAGSCGNSGCGSYFEGCHVIGQNVVSAAIDAVVRQSSGLISEKCLNGIINLADESMGDNSMPGRMAQLLPVDLEGAPFIFYQLYFYELIYQSVNHAGCKL